MRKLNVAKMGTNNSKYGTRRNEFEKGDQVICGMNDEYHGIVTKSTSRTVVVNIEGHGLFAFDPKFVRAVDDD